MPNKRRTSFKLGAWFGLSLLAVPNIGLAQSQTLGAMTKTAASTSLPALMTFVVTMSYVVGLYLVGAGIMKLKGYGKNKEGVMIDFCARFFAGAALLALPSIMGVGISSILQAAGIYSSNVASTSVGAVNDCMGAAATSGSLPLTCMAKNFGQNFVPVMIETIFGFCSLIGVFMIFKACYDLARSHQDGKWQGRNDGNWKFEFFFGFILANTPFFMYSIANTLGFNSSTITTGGFVGADTSSSLLSYTPPSGSSSAMLTQYAQLISWLFVILALFGVISFVRGWFILKASADGSGGGRKTAMGGVTHVVAGILLANAKYSTCLIVGTILGNGMGFCS